MRAAAIIKRQDPNLTRADMGEVLAGPSGYKDDRVRAELTDDAWEFIKDLAENNVGLAEYYIGALGV